VTTRLLCAGRFRSLRLDDAESYAGWSRFEIRSSFEREIFGQARVAERQFTFENNSVWMRFASSQQRRGANAQFRLQISDQSTGKQSMM
jgi:hypothetical protein